MNCSVLLFTNTLSPLCRNRWKNVLLMSHEERQEWIILTAVQKELLIKMNNQAAGLKFHDCVVQREMAAQFVLSQEDHVSSSRMMTVLQRVQTALWEKMVSHCDKTTQPSSEDGRAKMQSQEIHTARFRQQQHQHERLFVIVVVI